MYRAAGALLIVRDEIEGFHDRISASTLWAMPRRVVITGLGTASSLGIGISALWEGLVAGRCGLGPVTRFDPGGFRCRLAGEIKDLSAKDHVPKSYRKAVKVMARDTEIAVVAARLAVQDAGLQTRGTSEDGGVTTYPGERTACHIGAGLIAAETDELTSALVTARGEDGVFDLKKWGTVGGGGGMNNLQPLWMLKYLPNMLACHVTIIHGAEGPSNTLTCGEASGLLSIGESCRVIQRGAADVGFAGGAESKVNLMGVLRLEFSGRLAETGAATSGEAVVRPYDARSPGSILGEGGGILVLEEEAGAASRGAKAYCRLAGFGAGQSRVANIPSLGRDMVSGEGLEVAIEGALRDAGVTPETIDAIIPQAWGVPSVDETEASTLRAIFGERLSSIPLVTLTPMIGDCTAGNGGIHAAVGAMCLREQRLPARLHSGSPMGGLNAGPSPSESRAMRNVLVCTSGMGGQNAAIVLQAM